MRITLGMLTGRVRTNLMENAERLLEAQDRASSGKRIQRTSDDVPGACRAISLRSALSSIDQFNRNSNIASNMLSVTNDALNTVVQKIQDIRSLAFRAANSALNQEAFVGIATQLDQISAELQTTANTRYLGRYIFSGSMSNTEAIVENPGINPPYLFQGDNKAFNIQVAPGAYNDVNVTGDIVFNMDGAADPAFPDLFSTIQSLKEQVLAGDVQAISNKIQDVDAHLGNVTGIRSQVGSRINRLDAANEALIDSRLMIKDLLSKTEDVDLADAVIDLRTRENVYQSALATASRVLDFSLADFWK